MIIFENEGELDIRAAITFGVNVKEGDSPIGFFGTGLKYAIAVLLRTGHKVTINSGRDQYCFGQKTETIRGKEFTVVTMATDKGTTGCSYDIDLGFTTGLGPTWEVWMAYRELWSNARDEGGVTYQAKNFESATDPRPGLAQVIVEGPDIDAVHECRSDYIIDGEVAAYKVGDVEIYRGRPRGIFYRGIRVAKGIGDKPMKFTYNLLGEITLTEDRTAKYPWELEFAIKLAVMREADEEIASEIIAAGESNGEGKFDYSSLTAFKPSDGFMTAVRNCSRTEMGNINATAVQLFKIKAARNPKLSPAPLTATQRDMLADAMSFCEQIGFAINKYQVQVIEGLGDGVLGLAQGGRILIAAECFERGPQWVRMALIEEFVHLEYSVSDMTREMQTRFLMEIERVGSYAVECLSVGVMNDG